MINLIDTKQLNNKIDVCILAFNKDDVMSPELLAIDAYSLIDPDGLAPSLAEWGCTLELRRLAAKKIKGKFTEFDDKQPEQSDFFEGLQDRYHAFRNGEHVAVPEDQLTLKERYAVETRMEKEISKKQKHLLRFRVRTKKLVDEGYFDKSA